MSQDQIKIAPAIQYLIDRIERRSLPVVFGVLRDITDEGIHRLALCEDDAGLTRCCARLLLGLILTHRESQVPEDAPDRSAKITAIRRRFQGAYGSAESTDTRSIEEYGLVARRVGALPCNPDPDTGEDAGLEPVLEAACRGWAALRAAVAPPPRGAAPAARKARPVPPTAPAAPSVSDALASFISACTAEVNTDRASARAKLLAARAAIDAALAALEPEPEPVLGATDPAPVVEDGLDAFLFELASAREDVGGTSGAPAATQVPVVEAAYVPTGRADDDILTYTVDTVVSDRNLVCIPQAEQRRVGRPPRRGDIVSHYNSQGRPGMMSVIYGVEVRHGTCHANVGWDRYQSHQHGEALTAAAKART